MVDDKTFFAKWEELPALLEDMLAGQQAAFTALLVVLDRDGHASVGEVADLLDKTAAITERDRAPYLSRHRLDVFYLRRLAASLRPSPKHQPLSFTVYRGGKPEDER